MELADLQDGIHDSIGWLDYCNVPLMNCSTLKWGRESMAHLRAALDGRIEKKDTPALAFGRALHVKLLEPDLFACRYAKSEQCESVTVKGARCSRRSLSVCAGHHRCSQHAEGLDADPVELLSDADWHAVHEAARSAKASRAVKLLNWRDGKRTGCEATAIGTLQGVRCKARFDKIIPPANGRGFGVIVDVKKIAPPSTPGRKAFDRRFAEDIYTYGYHMQAAWYVDLAEAITGHPHRFWWLVVESGDPYTAVVRTADEYLPLGRIDYRDLLIQYAECQRTGVWPGYQDFGDVYPTEWVRSQYRDRLELQEVLT